MPEIVAVCISNEVGTKKKPVGHANLVEDLGMEGDAHAGYLPNRHVSLLALESIEKMRDQGLDVGPGDFAENITTQGIDLPSLPLGTRLTIGPQAVLQITQIGKECHTRCAIYYQAGDCIMPKEGVFARVVRGGPICDGDPIVRAES